MFWQHYLKTRKQLSLITSKLPNLLLLDPWNFIDMVSVRLRERNEDKQ